MPQGEKKYCNSIPANILFSLLLVSFPPVAFFNIYTHAQSVQLLHKNNSIYTKKENLDHITTLHLLPHFSTLLVRKSSSPLYL